MPTDDPSLTEPSKDQLIESIYRIALEPQTYDRFMGHWDDYISARLSDLADLHDKFASGSSIGQSPEIAKHFEIASRLLEQMEVKPQTDKDLGGSKDPQFLINSTGRIVWHNSAASRDFGISKESTVNDLDLQTSQREGLDRLRAALADPSIVPPNVILKLTGTTSSKPHYFYARILPEQHDEDIILVSKVTPDWPDEMDTLLADAFTLSPSEVAICAMIADGHGAAHIADLRDSALATVRTQIKRIMAKTGCSTQAELVRLLHSVMRVAEKERTPAVLQSHAPDRTLYVNLPDRMMPVEQFGDPKGRPVIFFHGMLDGNTMTPECQALLRKHRMRLVCPVRPWFGSAIGTDGPSATAPDRLARDVLAMMDQLGIKAAPLVGHMAGSVYAFATASAAPKGRVIGVVPVSGGVPITSLSQFSSMSTRQRLVAYTARFTPRLLPFVLRAGISQMESGGNQKFMRSLYEAAPDDLDVVADPEMTAIILTGYRFTVQQGHKAFEIDSHQVVNDWSDRVDGSDVPVHVIHGATDPVVSFESVEAFYSARHNRARITCAQDCGQLILYKHPELVIEALDDMLAAHEHA